MSLQEIKSIKSKSDIVKVISHFVELKRDGANYTATCPFHNERSKSFSVSATKGIFKCFGCGVSGDVIDFVMRQQNSSYKDAIKWISDHENIEPDKNYISQPIIELPTSYIKRDVFAKSLSKSNRSNLITWLQSLYPEHKDFEYYLSESKHWPGAVVFWYVDINQNVRSGKIMHYSPDTGKRTKDPKPLITWVHKVLKLSDFNMSICLFGEHLLRIHPESPVCIVESEKTAIIASIEYPEFIWLASGSLTNLSYKRCEVLKGRDITLYPDVGAEERWQEKLDQLSELIPGTWKMKRMDSEIKGYDLCDQILDKKK